MNRSVEPSALSGASALPPPRAPSSGPWPARPWPRGPPRSWRPPGPRTPGRPVQSPEALGARIETGPDRAVVQGIPSAALGARPPGPPPSRSPPPAGSPARPCGCSPPWRALFPRPVVLAGEGTLARRPVGPIEEPLRALGAECSTARRLRPGPGSGPPPAGPGPGGRERKLPVPHGPPDRPAPGRGRRRAPGPGPG
ncbi:MAG: hypothetical protein M0C28_25605 [Candidatus Moduliflexus flocculans]|nr:hypothetical protein [Candidatus Moduliflexus flocculans]